MPLYTQNQSFLRMWYLGQTSLTPALQISKNGATFTDPAGGATPATEVGGGWYKHTFASADADTLGDLAYTFGAGIMSPEFHDQIVAFDPNDHITLGLTALPSTVAGFASGLPVLNSFACVQAEVLRWFGATAPALVGGNVPCFASDISTGALAKFFLGNSGQTYGSSVSGSVVKEIAANSGGGAGDPLNHPVPGTYGQGTAGYVLGNNLDASIKAAIQVILNRLGRGT